MLMALLFARMLRAMLPLSFTFIATAIDAYVCATLARCCANIAMRLLLILRLRRCLLQDVSLFVAARAAIFIVYAIYACSAIMPCRR